MSYQALDLIDGTDEPDRRMMNDSIAHYNILEKLGAGGMGEVYLAEDTRLGRKVALKLLPASFHYDTERRERFLQEARAASMLRSPNVTAIYDLAKATTRCSSPWSMSKASYCQSDLKAAR